MEILFSLIADTTAATVRLCRCSISLFGQRPWPAGLRLGVPEEFFGNGLCPEVAASVRRAITLMESLGAQVQPISLPHSAYAIDTYLTLVTAEASSNLARYDGVRYGKRVEADDAWDMFRKTRTKGFGPG